MENYKHVVVKIAQDDKFEEVIARLNNINYSEGDLYCAEVSINLFDKKKEELCPDDNIPPYTKKPR